MDDTPHRPGRLQSWLSWAMVVFGLALLSIFHPPTLPYHLARLNQGLSATVLKDLGLLLAVSVVPGFGLWRLSQPLGLPRWLPALFPCFPIAIVGVYLLKPFLDRIHPPR